ncbi:MAG: DUF547 domain-containing protein, partial [Acidobacteria bacterium]|nr:DUF547 domain-containing protein [Acidobacteriota bacterium]
MALARGNVKRKVGVAVLLVPFQLFPPNSNLRDLRIRAKVRAHPRWLQLVGTALALALLGASAGLRAQEPLDYSAYARVLEHYVTPEGHVRYAELKRNPGDLEAFLQQLALASPESHPALFATREAQLAYWINAYNAFVVHAVVEAYPVNSVRDLRFGLGLLFFKRARFVAGGKKYSLDDIEHGI